MFSLSVQKHTKRKTFKECLKSMHVIFPAIQQKYNQIKAKYVAKQYPDIQVKDKLQGKECCSREIFRLIVATKDENRKDMIHEI